MRAKRVRVKRQVKKKYICDCCGKKTVTAVQLGRAYDDLPYDIVCKKCFGKI